MATWTCPECSRVFGRVRQGHESAPAMTLDEYLATGPPHERPIAEVVIAHLEGLGPVHVEPVSVGIFFKRGPCFAQLRPMTKWMALSFSLPHPVRHRTITRKVVEYSGRHHHVANLRVPDDFDDELRGHLTAAYLAAEG